MNKCKQRVTLGKCWDCAYNNEGSGYEFPPQFSDNIIGVNPNTKTISVKCLSYESKNSVTYINKKESI